MWLPHTYTQSVLNIFCLNQPPGPTNDRAAPHRRSAGCKLLRWFYCPAAIKGVGANDPQLQSSHFHSFYFYLSFQEALKSSKLLLERFSKEKPKWKVGQEWLHLSRVLRLWWCHYWTISTLKYYSRLSPHVRCQANCFLPKLITWTLDSYQFYTAVIGNICWVYLFLTHP